MLGIPFIIISIMCSLCGLGTEEASCCSNREMESSRHCLVALPKYVTSAFWLKSKWHQGAIEGTHGNPLLNLLICSFKIGCSDLEVWMNLRLDSDTLFLARCMFPCTLKFLLCVLAVETVFYGLTSELTDSLRVFIVCLLPDQILQQSVKT